MRFGIVVTVNDDDDRQRVIAHSLLQFSFRKTGTRTHHTHGHARMDRNCECERRGVLTKTSVFGSLSSGFRHTQAGSWSLPHW